MQANEIIQDMSASDQVFSWTCQLNIQKQMKMNQPNIKNVLYKKFTWQCLVKAKCSCMKAVLLQHVREQEDYLEAIDGTNIHNLF